MSADNVTTPGAALMRLAASTAEAVAQVLDMYAPGLAQRGQVQVLPDSGDAFSSVPRGAIAASVSYVDGVTGANVFVMTPKGARAMAIAMGVPPEGDTEDGKPIELSELELSAVSEASNQMMAAAAAAIGVVLGQEVNISPPDTQVLDQGRSGLDRYGTAPHATSATFMIDGETCRLIQLVPAAFVVRMVHAMDELEDNPRDGDHSADAGALGESADVFEGVGLVDALSGIRVRVWAELGRTQIPLSGALELPLGSVVDLDCSTDAPVDLYVNGLKFAQGRLLVTDDGEWAVSLESIGAPSLPASLAAAAQSQLKGALT